MSQGRGCWHKGSCSDNLFLPRGTGMDFLGFKPGPKPSPSRAGRRPPCLPSVRRPCWVPSFLPLQLEQGQQPWGQAEAGG